MTDINLLVRNYRCFSETNPVNVVIGRGFTAFVGPNNSGKSSFLRLFHELKHVFRSTVADRSVRFNQLRVQASLINQHFFDVQDPQELFCNFNDKPISLIFSKSQSSETIDPVVLETQRASPESWYVEYVWRSSTLFQPVDGQKGVLRHYELVSGDGHLLSDGSEILSVISDLANSIYISSFRNAVNQGSGSYFGLEVGTSFISTWDVWKSGFNKAQNNQVMRVTEDIRLLMGFKTLEINATQDNTTLQVIINGKSYLLRELGSGLAQLIIVLANVAIKKPAYIFIDEPEINLHPSLQIDFLTSLGSYAKEGVFFSTHSIGLARAASDRIYSTQQKDGCSVIKPYEATSRFTEFLGEMSFSSYKELGCEHVLLVEGVTDVKAYQQILRKYKLDHRVVILPLGGDALTRGGVEQELAEVLRITKKVSAIIDSECSSESDEPSLQRKAFEALCKKMNINVHITKKRATENYLSDKAIKEEKGPKYEALEPYEKPSSEKLFWGKIDNWRIIRRMDLEEIEKTDLGDFFRKLKTLIG